jgi:hypothetical protein
MTAEDRSVSEFRLKNLRSAPKRWTLWVGLFTAANGAFLTFEHDVVILAGLVLPFLLSGPLPHLIAGCAFVALSAFIERSPAVAWVPLNVYVLDLALAAYQGWWSGVVMHVVVFAFVGLALFSARSLERKLQLEGGDPV